MSRPLGLVGLALLLVGACKPAAKRTAVTAKSGSAAARTVALPDSAEQVAYGMRTVLTYRGVNNGVLLSDTALFFEQGARIDLKRVNMTFYASTGLKDGLLTAKTGRYDARLARLEARGDAVVTRNDGRRLTTQQLVYDQARNEVLSDSAFVFTDKGRQITGIGFVSDPQ
nr:LPS export ABC transporter periplasmic protein LptC [Gemmatimonadaceae bacterium]